MRIGCVVLLAMLPALAATSALAHSTEGVASGFVSGLLHPVLGPDHMLAMIAVGLWGAQLGMPLMIALPIAFPMVVALGGLLGVLGVVLPGVEIGIAMSALLLGLAVAMAFRAPVWLAVALVAAFAVFHGHAHGQELPEAASPLPYGLGFVLSTGLLHMLGVAIGLLHEWRGAGPAIVRFCGALIALSGAYFLSNATGLL
ncbi:MAG: HupE/UreJ family protein [Rhodobacteraceae bacterium]|nr:HupE/UreJ family protein [Paracoccaceae bacterium]